MSQLLDALKRAEDAKRAKAEAASGQVTTGSTDETAPTLTTDKKAADSGRRSERSNVRDEVSIAPEDRSAPNKSDQSADDALAVYPVLTLERIDTGSPDVDGTFDLPQTVKPASRADHPSEYATIPNPSTRSPGTSIRPKADELVLTELLQAELSSGKNDGTGEAPTKSSATAAFRAARSSATSQTQTMTALDSGGALSFQDSSKNVSTRTGQATQSTDRDAVKNVFAVKTAGRAETRPQWVAPVIAVAIVAIGSLGWYVWNEVSGINRKSGARNQAVLVPAPPNPATAPIAPTTQKSPASASPGASPDLTQASQADLPPPLPPLLPPPASALPQAVPLGNVTPNVSLVPLTPRESLAEKIESLPPPQNLRGTTVNLRPSTPAQTVTLNPALSAGYAALSSGDYSQAKRHYAEAIATDPTNIDAHLGFATAAARTSEVAIAEHSYLKVLEIDPRNVTAATALLMIASNNKNLPEAVNLEGEINRLISMDPGVAASHFALGNMFAAQRRWSEAQPSFFEALRLAPQNPDYAYNLAVSLDQLGKSKPAQEFYRRALATKGQAQFDRLVVEQRLKLLAATNSAQ